MLPPMSVDWWLRGAVSEVAAAECQRLSIQAAQLQTAANKRLSTTARTADVAARVRSLKQQAGTLDRACVAWGERLPPTWKPQTIAWEDGRRIDIYSDMYIASVWNLLRCTRLSLAAVAVRCAAWERAPADYRTTPEHVAAARDCPGLLSDIIASVPFHLGWHRQHRDVVEKHYRQQRHERRINGADEPQPQPPSFVCGDESDHKGLAGYFLAWPLAKVNSQDYTSDAQRAWVVGRLRYIADDVGVRQAGILAGVCCTPSFPDLPLPSPASC